MWLMLLLVAIAGAVGGVVNTILANEGFRLPGKEEIDGYTIFRFGWIGNVIIGAAAAMISWGLYGPFASYYIVGMVKSLETSTAPDVGLTLSSFVGAILIGVGGARWLTDWSDKGFLKAVASIAASAQPSASISRQIALSSPIQALNIARNMK